MEEPAGDFFKAYVLDTSFASPCLDSAMNSAVWRFLPDDLLQRVVLVLPARSQARFRVVSKIWLRRLTCAKFQKKSTALALASGRHFCGIAHKGQGELWAENENIYGASSRYRVFQLSLDFLPKQFQHIRKSHDMGLHPLCLVQSGLIALESKFPEDYKLCLVNPVNQTWKVLEHPDCPPGSSVRAISVLGGDSDHAGYSFKVLVYCADLQATRYARMTGLYSSRTFMVYCSKTNAWTTTTLDFCLHDTFVDRRFVYARLLENKTTSLEDVQTLHPRLAQGSGTRQVDGHGEGYFSVTAQGRLSEHSFVIWKLNETSKKWESISVLPDDIKARMLQPNKARAQDGHEVQGGEDGGDWVEMQPGGEDEDEALYLAMKYIYLGMDVDLCSIVGAELVEEVIFMKAVVGHSHVYDLAFHIEKGSWEIVLTRIQDINRKPFVWHGFFKPKPFLQLC